MKEQIPNKERLKMIREIIEDKRPLKVQRIYQGCFPIEAKLLKNLMRFVQHRPECLKYMQINHRDECICGLSKILGDQI